MRISSICWRFSNPRRASATCRPTSPRWAPVSTPWAGAAANSWERACASSPRRNWMCPGWVRRRRPSRHRLRTSRLLDVLVESGQERPQQQTNRLDLVFQPMVGVEEVQRRLVLARPANAVFDRHDDIVPAVHDGGGTGHVLRRVFYVTRHIKGGRQQEQAAGPKPAGRGGGDMPAHARAHQHQGWVEFPADVQELADAIAGVIQASIVDRLYRPP